MKDKISRAIVPLLLSGICLCCIWNCCRNDGPDWSSQIDEICSRLWKIENPQLNSVSEQLDTMKASFPKFEAVDKAFRDYSDSLSKVQARLSSDLSGTAEKIKALAEAFDAAAADAAAEGGSSSEIEVRKINTVKADVLAQIAAAGELTDNAVAELGNAVLRTAPLEVRFRERLADAKKYAATGLQDDWAAASVSTLDHGDALSETLAAIAALAKGLDSFFSPLATSLQGSLRSEAASAMRPVLSLFPKDSASEIIGDYAAALRDASLSLERAYSTTLSAPLAVASESLRSWVNTSLGEYGTLVETDSLLSVSGRRMAAELSSQKSYLEAIAASEIIACDVSGAIEDNAKAYSELSESLSRLHSGLASGGEKLKEAYRKAVREAIASNGGCLKGEIAFGVVEANLSSSELAKGAETEEKTLGQRVAGTGNEVSIIRKSLIQNDSAEMDKKIEELSRRIQSIVFIPEYSDGKATVYYTQDGDGTIHPLLSHLRFDIRPSSAAEELAAVWRDALSLRGIYTMTRAAAGEEFDISITGVSADGGRLDITYRSSDIEECFFENEVSASICLLISRGDAQKSSAYVPLTKKSLNWIVIPDEVFRLYLIDHFDTDGDGNLSNHEAAAVKTIDVSGLAPSNHIHSLEGIEHFTALESLNCEGHHLTSLDLSSNTGITTLNCKGNRLVSLDITKCTALETLDLSGNSLTDIDLEQNVALKQLIIDGNETLEALDVSWKTALETLSAQNTGISRLDLRGCSALRRYNIFEPSRRDIAIIVSSQDFLSGIEALSNYGVSYYENDTPFFFNGSIEVDGRIWQHYDSAASESGLYGGTCRWDEAKSRCPSGWKLPAKGDFASLSANASPWTEYGGMQGRWFSGSQEYSENVPAVFLNAGYDGSGTGVYWGNDYVADRTLNALYFSGSQIDPNYRGYTFDFSNDRFGSRCVKERRSETEEIEL